MDIKNLDKASELISRAKNLKKGLDEMRTKINNEIPLGIHADKNDNLYLKHYEFNTAEEKEVYMFIVAKLEKKYLELLAVIEKL